MAEEKTQVLVFGLGAIGSFYTFILSKNPNIFLAVIARSNYHAVKQSGLQITSTTHGTHTIKPDTVFASPSEAAAAGLNFDYIVCAHKAIQPDKTPPLFKDLIHKGTTFVIIQNGVGNEDPFHALYPDNTVISCVTWTGAVQQYPGVVVHNGNEDMQMGLFPSIKSKREERDDARQERLGQFAELLRNGGTKFSIEQDIQVKRWEKVVWNAAWNPLTTLTSVPVQDFLKATPEAGEMTRELMREMVTISQRCGVPLEHSLAEQLIEKVLAMEPPIYSSMYQDAKEGRQLEVDVILGTPMRRARELGMGDQVPVLRTIYAMTMAVNGRLSG